MSVPDIVIETRGLTKQYGGVRALDGLDLQVPAGSIYGFLGRNGAGKTTTIRTLMGMASATSGEGRVLGRPIGNGARRSRCAAASRTWATIARPGRR